MANLVPVDNDPFADTEASAGPTLVPVDHDPFETTPANVALKDVPGDIVHNFLPDVEHTLGSYVTGAARALADPTGTAKKIGLTGAATALGTLMPGAPERLGLGKYDIVGDTAQKVIDAASHPSATYEDAKRAVANHPFNSLLNVLALTPAGAPEKLGALTLGRLGLTTATKTAGLADRLLGKPYNAILSGTSPEELTLAQEAGALGGETGKRFRARLVDPQYETLQGKGQAAIGLWAKDRAAKFQNMLQALAQLGPDVAPLSYQPVTDAIANARASLPGPKTRPATAASHDIIDQMEAAVQEHQTRPGYVGTEPLAMHDLKVDLRALRNTTEQGTNARRVADDIYNAQRGELTSNLPGYAEGMEDYGDTTQRMNEAVKSLRLGERSGRGSSAGALISALRPGNGLGLFGSRASDLEALSKYDPMLRYELAGAALNPIAPRGPVARFFTAENLPEGVLKIAAPLVEFGAEFASPAVAKLLPFLLASSPRLSGRLRYAVGASSRYARKIGATQKNLGLLGEGARLYGQQDDEEPQGLLGQ